jgi:dienelactone hydrolase
MLRFFKSLFSKIKSFFNKITPGKIAWEGANKAIATTAVICWIAGALAIFVFASGTPLGLIPTFLGLILAFLVSAGFLFILWLLKKLPKSFLWVLPGAFFLTTFIFSDGLGAKFPLLAICLSGLAGAGLFTLIKKHSSPITLLQKITASIGLVLGMAGLVWGLIWLFDTGEKPEIEPINAAQLSDYQPDHIKGFNPAARGPFEVNYMTYGSGKDKQRKEFGLEATIITDSVDASRLIDNWEGLAGKLRTKFWGFDETALPINGRVWYPEGDGPFPISLIVHGNHGMEDFSDTGYEYLGELLASQGIIMVSVDENFINSTWKDVFGDGLDEENDARGWLLLEHLKYWRTWNTTSGGMFQDKVDLDNIAVMGHSRGGEAAAVAAFLNKLKYYPDDAKQEFDFNFNIKSVVAIAPVDGQYKPGEVGTPLEDVNYLVIHGANDGDVSSFGGLRQYERVKFTEPSNLFKSAVYIYGANHGQFNTTWGNSDSPQPFASLLNKKALLPMADQLEIGKVYISAFLQATLQGKEEYKTLFQDHRSGRDWLPNTIYLNQFESANWKALADFEEDLDLTTTSSKGIISGENLTVWREQMVGMKWSNRGSRALYVGWDSLAYEGKIASIEFSIDPRFDLKGLDALTFELSEAKENSYPDKERDEKLSKLENNDSQNNKGDEESEGEDDEEEEGENEEDDSKIAPAPINFTIELKDKNGVSAKILLSDYSFLQRQIEVDILKNPELDTNDKSEAVYNTFFISRRLSAVNFSDLNIEELTYIKLIFDQTPKGVIIIDKIMASLK